MKKHNFENTTVLVTGASSGIGKEFAKQIANKGANLILTARSHSRLSALADELEAKHPNIWVKTIPLDLGVPNAADQLYRTVDDMGLSVDYLINNAGFGKFCEFSDASFETYHKMLMLNINAVVQLTYLFLPHIKNMNSGGVINVASTGSFQPLPYQAVYGASKSFVLSFTEALAGELLDTDIRVMALCPGTTESRFMETANADTSKMTLAPAREVVGSALVAYERDRLFTVSGTINYIVSLLPRIVSRKRAVKIVANMFKDDVLRKSA